MATNALCSWDFTISCEHVELQILKIWLKENCKKFCFQKEKGEETGYLHFQGRVSLKVKTRKIISEHKFHWSPTSTANKDNDFYVMKNDTRVEGPWKDTDKETYIPRQIREIKFLWEWQQYIVDHCGDWDTRSINVIIDTKGNSGKSTIKGYMRAYGLGRPLPFANDYKDIMRNVMDIPTSTCYLIDMPRAIAKDRLFQFFAGIESVKDGYAFDDRYKFEEKFFDCPNIWIFTNAVPERTLLSNDRWVFWNIIDKRLVRWFPPDEEDY